MKTKTNTKGFTLVELLVVITIISILAVGGLSLFASAQQKARDSVRQTDLRSFTTTIEQMNLDGTGGGGSCKGGFPATGESENMAEKIIEYGYLDQLPTDPNNAGNFIYRYDAPDDCAAYEFSVKFEHKANSLKMEDDEGDDDERFEHGTPGCLDKTGDNCSATGDSDYKGGNTDDDTTGNEIEDPAED